MKTDDLIQKLSGELQPVKPLMSPFRLTLLFSLLGLGLIGVSFLFMTTRQDLLIQLTNPWFLFETSLSFLLAVLALALSVYLSRPGRVTVTQKLQKLTLAVLGLVLVYDFFRVLQMNTSQIFTGMSLTGIECFISVFGYAVILSSALIIWLRKGASVNPQLSGLVLGTAGIAVGNVSIIFFCGIENGMHTLIWHFSFPLVAALIIGAAMSRFVFKW